MAIDTRSRRASVLGLALAAQLTLPLVDGAVGTADRQHLAYCYCGIASSVEVTADFTLVVESEDRVLVVGSESRVLVVDADDRVLVVPS